MKKEKSNGMMSALDSRLRKASLLKKASGWMSGILLSLFSFACALPRPALPLSAPAVAPPSFFPSQPPSSEVAENHGQEFPLRVTVAISAEEDPTSWNRRGAEALAIALQQTGQFEVTTAVVTPSSALALPPPPPATVPYTRLVVMTATQNRLMDAKSGGVNGYSADDAAAELVTASLLQRGYRVVERQALNAVLREQGLQQGGMVDQSTAVRIGKLAGADAIVIANVYNASSNYHQGFQGGTGNAFVDVAGKLLAPSGTVHRVDMTVKLIDTQTAEVAWLADESKESRPGENTSHIQLLRDVVAALSLPSPATSPSPTSVSLAKARSPEVKQPIPKVRAAQQHLRQLIGAEHNAQKSIPAVRAAQQHLRQLGYDPGPVDGIMGPKTRAALRQFQQDHGLTVSGELASDTQAALKKLSSSISPSREDAAY